MQRTVIVLNKVNGFLIQIGQQLMGNLFHTHFGVTHGGRTITIEGAEVALAINQRITHVEILRHPDDCVISRVIAMRVIFTDDITDDSRRLHIAPVEGVVQNIHGKQNTTMHGLQAVAHIRQSTTNNDAHGIVEVRLPEFIFDVN